jgi:hypothetical protein
MKNSRNTSLNSNIIIKYSFKKRMNTNLPPTQEIFFYLKNECKAFSYKQKNNLKIFPISYLIINKNSFNNQKSTSL